ncbi:Crp/Fnr family transcriptional regulator [Neobacillus sp. PS3-40]|jgi:CRP-like cAMP-binding protein|uniref:Crp/Fnr family transcriptional regulator n=1 Tax=Neobacillus sp. PS3-40 TaxID=3070679 RepID=UPI0027E161EF|nr:Crp/Fnr family transcriptional regulator [Neobacillus sp. PS3-40]WML43364.1 Crp/Fnr family transcriptional regulator [Neobacillus sp. PS3-40]
MQSLKEVSTELHELFEMVHHIRKMEKGTFLFQEGAIANELYIVQSGILQVSKIIPDGRELTLRMCKKGDLIGEIDIFCPSQKYLLSGRVAESGEVAVIMKDVLEEKLSKNLPLSLVYMKWMSQQYRKTQTKFRDLVLHGKKGALYSTLIRISNSYGIMKTDGIMIRLPLTNQELANFCGTSREVVNRLLSDLRKANIISIDKGTITIHDIDYLRNEIDCERCPVEICRIN